MTAEQKINQQEEFDLRAVLLSKEIKFGVLGSIVGTLVMDLVMIVEFSIMGLPLDTYLALIGSVVGRGVPMGVIIHIVFGSLLGIVCGAAVLKVDALHIDSVRKGVGLGVLVGIATIPFCIVFAIITNVPIADMLTFSIPGHLTWGAVLGVIAGYGLRPATAARGK
jgi:hypothetical protein